MSTVTDPRSNAKMGQARPSISVVICAYSSDRLGQLREAIDSLHQQTYSPLEIVVVVDHNPALQAQLDELTSDRLRVACNEGEQGLADARNSGIGLARGEVVAFIDDDAVADSRWLEQLVERYRDPNVIGAGGRIMPRWDGGRKPAWMPEEFLWVVGCTYRGMPELGAVRNMIGCNMSFRSHVFEEVGRFNPRIGRLGNQLLGGEETEMCIRALSHWPDKKIVYTRDAIVHHHVPRSRQTVRYFARRCYFEGVSKVMVRRLWGAAGTSTEVGYLSRALPRAAARDARNVVLAKEVAASASRIAAITLGVGTVGAGFAVGMLRGPNRPQ